ncbi:hypothetical protein [Gayadomonas joobiniege]|uniref:hypothetical protein n=1 Tax=Gayadomonas joobiniege TaxID=1234606 RepID=UPI00037AE5CC|nr:hypothetical protein [Gayadomonas joobiniege]
MLNPLIRLTFLATIWKKYQVNIKQLLLTLVLLILVHLIYLDATEYLRTTESNTYLLSALIIKWLLNFLIVAICWLRIKQHYKTKQQGSLPKAQVKTKTSADNNSAIDPFARIREKKTLRSRGDILIDNKPKQK